MDILEYNLIFFTLEIVKSPNFLSMTCAIVIRSFRETSYYTCTYNSWSSG